MGSPLNCTHFLDILLPFAWILLRMIDVRLKAWPGRPYTMNSCSNVQIEFRSVPRNQYVESLPNLETPDNNPHSGEIDHQIE